MFLFTSSIERIRRDAQSMNDGWEGMSIAEYRHRVIRGWREKNEMKNETGWQLQNLLHSSHGG